MKNHYLHFSRVGNSNTLQNWAFCISKSDQSAVNYYGPRWESYWAREEKTRWDECTEWIYSFETSFFIERNSASEACWWYIPTVEILFVCFGYLNWGQKQTPNESKLWGLLVGRGRTPAQSKKHTNKQTSYQENLLKKIKAANLDTIY